MSVSGNQDPQLASGWNIIAPTTEEHQRFLEVLSGSYEHNVFNALCVLGILAAGQTYLEQNEGMNEVTLVRRYPNHDYSQVPKQLIVGAGGIGYYIRYYTESKITHGGELVVFSGQLPPPAEVLGATGLENLARQLAGEATRRNPPEKGIDYVTLTRQHIGRALSIGYANPYTGRRIEGEFHVDALKERHGYPPPPPPPPSRGGYHSI